MRCPSVLPAVALATAMGVAAAVSLDAQTRRAPARPAAPPKTTKIAPELTCPSPLGAGAASNIAYCDVMSGRDPLSGVLIKLPPHRGPVTLTFDLHNRHT